MACIIIILNKCGHNIILYSVAAKIEVVAAAARNLQNDIVVVLINKTFYKHIYPSEQQQISIILIACMT